jgi:hypothetical protein
MNLRISSVGLLTGLLLASVSMSLVQVSASSDPVWTAHWLSPAETAPNSWTCYRKNFMVKNVPEHVLARIAVDSKYWLWINDRLVVREGGLKRGPTPTGTYYDELDLAPHLVKGRNTIAILAWYFGKNGFSHNSSGRAGVVFEANLEDQTLASDATWKILQHPAFGKAGGVQPNRRLPESSILFDARKDLPDWTSRRFDDSAWSTPVVGITPPGAPWGDLEKRPTKFWKDYGLKDYTSTRILTNTPDGGQVIAARLPYNAHVTPWLNVEASAGKTVDMRTDNFMGGSEPNVHAEYVTRDGVQEFETLGWMNGHEVLYTLPAGVKPLSLKYRETGFNAEFTGRFLCNDPFYNTLWIKARRTLYVTMRDSYMDCPDRERSQWWGDAVNELGEVFYAFDPSAASLTRKAMLELARWQRADNTLYSPVPSGKPANELNRQDPGDGTWNSELPPQMLASVGKYGFWTYFQYSGDRETIATVYPHVRGYLNVWKLDVDGLVIHRKGDWDWEDWGENIDAPVLDSAWYSLALEGAINMARVSGHEQDIPEWESRMKAIRGGFNKQFWTGKEYRSPGYKGDTDDRANAMAVVSGLAGEDKFAALRDVFEKHRNASPYMEKYVLEALFLMNAPEQALDRMKARYQKQVASELTTLWEGWGLGSEGFGGGTYNHAWSGGPLTVLSQYAAGISPLEPAYALYQVRPQMGSLQNISTLVPTAKGIIQLTLKNKDNAFELDLNSPQGTIAQVCIPQIPGKRLASLSINGRKLKENDTTHLKGMKYLPESEHSGRFEVVPGRWKFKAQYE